MNRTILARHQALAAGVGYVCLHVALMLGIIAYAGGDASSLAVATFPTIAYFLLITAFGGVMIVLTAPSVSRWWWVTGGVFGMALVAIRYVFGTAAGILTITVVFAYVFLPYVVAACVIIRLLAGRFAGDRLSNSSTSRLTRRGLFIAGVILVATVGGSVLAVAAAPPATPPADWSVDRQLEYLKWSDQHDRKTGAVVDRSRDYQRTERVLSLLASDQIESPHEQRDAVVVLQHGTCPEHYELAHRLALVANESGKVDATRWVHLTYDRWQISIGQPQRYGTQIGTRSVNAECYPPVPSGLTVSEVNT